MRAIEFETTVDRNGQLVLPQDLAHDIPSGERVRVVLLWDASPTDAAWREAGRRRFEDAYCHEDAVYEQLASNEASNR